MKKHVFFFAMLLNSALLIQPSYAQDGYCLDFDSVNDYVALPAFFSGNGQIQELTVSGWVRLFGDGGGWSVIDFDRSEYFNLEIGWNDRSTGFVNFATTGSDGTIHDMSGTTDVRDGQWHFVCGVYDGVDKRIYVDGVLDAISANAHGGLYLGTGLTRYGIIGDGSEANYYNGPRNNFYFDGLLDNISVWSIALSDIEIMDIMQNGIASPGTLTDLFLYYDCNEGSGQILTDSGPNGYHGQLGNSFNPDPADPYWLDAEEPTAEYTFYFNGSDHYAYIFNSDAINIGGPYQNRTVEVWFFANNINKSAHQVIYEEGGNLRGFNIYILNGVLYVGGWNETETSWMGTWHSTGAISSQRWHHVALRLQNGTSVPQPDRFKGYLDGVEIGSGPGTMVYAHSGDICIARNGGTRFHNGVDNTPGEHFEGRIDELRIWNSARSVNQLRQNIHRRLISPEAQPNLVAYINLNEADGRYSWDRSNSGNAAKLINIAYSNWLVSTAPIPYYAKQNGNWNNTSTWAQGQYYPNTPWARVITGYQVSATSEIEVLDLDILSGGKTTITPSSFLTVNGSLTNLAGTGGLVVQSNASGTGSLIHNTPNVSGTVQQYLTEEKWHYVSSPITGALSGVYYDIYLIDWNEPDSSWSFIVPVNIPLLVAEGYGAYASDALTGPATVSYAGALNTGDKNAAVTFNNNAGQGHGWNLVGNPYPSSLEWNVNWNMNNMDATAYFWNGVQYLTWNRLTEIGTAPSGEIPVTQGFFVKANGPNPALTMPQTGRIHSYQPFYKNSAQTEPYLHLTIKGKGYSDKLIIMENPSATKEFDSDFDAYELGGIDQCPQIYSLADGHNLTVNTLPMLAHGLVIPVGFQTGSEEIYIVSCEIDKSLFDELDVFIKDKQTNKLIDLKKHTQFKLYTKAGTVNDRLEILFFSNSSGNEKLSGISDPISMYADRDRIRVEFEEEMEALVEVYTLLGQKVFSSEVAASGSVVTGNLPTNSLYLVYVNTGNGTTTGKVFLK